MSHTLATPADLIAAGPPWDFLFFWGHTPKTVGVVDRACLSQWYPAPFSVDGVGYATAEHWMMVHKARLSGDADAEAAILATTDPADAKRLGRGVRGFDRQRWGAAAVDVVVAGNRHKFSAHPDLRAFLLETGERTLVEASPADAIWGIGLAATDAAAADPARWKGRNQLGFALMAARAALRDG